MKKSIMSAIFAMYMLFWGANCSLANDANDILSNCYISKGDLACVKRAISLGADINSQDEYGNTALVRASFYGQYEIAEYLLKNNAKVGFKSNKEFFGERQGAQAIHEAARQGHKKIVELLLSHGADINAKTDYNITPLFCAIKNQWYDIAQFLLDKGADPTIASGLSNDCFTNTFSALMCNTEEQLRRGEEIGVQLLNKGVYYEGKGTFGTSLCFCIKSRLKKLSLAIASKGLSINEDCGPFPYDGITTPLNLAIEYKLDDLIITLIDQGADINKGNRKEGVFGEKLGSSLTWALNQRNEKIAILLLSKGVEVFPGSNDRVSDLYRAKSSNLHTAERIISLNEPSLIKTAAEKELAKYNLAKPKPIIIEKEKAIAGGIAERHEQLLRDIEEGRFRNVQQFVENGGDVNYVSKAKVSPLTLAVAFNREEILLYLLKHGAKPQKAMYPYSSKKDTMGQDCLKDPWGSVLGCAITPRNVNISGTREDSGVYYIPILLFAVHEGRTDVARILLENGANVNFEDRYYGSALNSAISQKNYDLINLILEKQPNVNKPLKSGKGSIYSSLQIAVDHLDKNKIGDIACRLITLGANPQDMQINGDPMLFAALSSNSSQFVNILLAKGVSPNGTNKSGTLALVYAVDYSGQDIVELLIKKGAKIPPVYDYAKSAALNWEFDKADYWLSKASKFKVSNSEKERNVAKVIASERQKQQIAEARKKAEEARRAEEFRRSYNATKGSTDEPSSSFSNKSSSGPVKGVKSVNREGNITIVECNDGDKLKVYHRSEAGYLGYCTYPGTIGNYSCENAIEWTKKMCK